MADQQTQKRVLKRTGSALWKGALKDGSGTVSTQSHVLNQTQYSFTTRFQDGVGTNPEELIAAAHAGCFSMALAHELSKANLTPDSIETTATLYLENQAGNWTVTSIHLEVNARVPAAKQDSFETAADAAKSGCPISRLLKAEITMAAKLLS